MRQRPRNLKRTRTVCRLLLFFFCWNAVPTLSWSAAEEGVDLKLDTASDNISMSFDGALLKDVLLLFSQQSGMNFVASQDVESKKVTVYFEDVSPKDALDAIISANSLSYSKKPGSDIFLVYAANRPSSEVLITRVIRLKYMRLSSSPLDVGGAVTISDLKSSAAGSSTSSSSDSGGASGAGAAGGVNEKGADAMVTRLLSPQGRLAVDVHTNSLIITDTKTKIDEIEDVLAMVDVPPSQVILEVQVMEVDKGLASDLGVEWGGTDGKLVSFASGIRTTAFPFTENFLNRNQGVKPSAFVDTLNATTAVPSNLQYGTINATNFAATLHYLESDNKTKVLARPRVLTQNNEAATIRVVTNQTIGVTTSSTDTGSASTTETGVPERYEVGVVMRMTPQINEDDSVLLFLEPSVTTVAASASFDFLDPTTRMVRTMARVKDNQTLVIGGLIDGNETSTKRKLPFLGDLPGIGRAFRYDAVDKTDRELLVFITPHIARGATSMGNRSATAKGQDVPLKRMLNEFMDEEMDNLSGDFHSFEKTKNSFFTTDQDLIRDSERRLSNPLVDKQMSQALDALSPQLVDTQINQSLDRIGSKKYPS